jgi:ribosomal protein S6--L-glutamate ligase
MKVGILTWDKAGYDPDEPALAETGRSRGHAISMFAIEDISYVPRARGGFDVFLAGEPAQSFDAIISRADLNGDYSPGAWQDRVERLTLLGSVPGVRVFDPADARVRASKLLGTQRLAEAGIPVPPTQSATTLADVAHACREWGTIVVKPSFEMRGRGVEQITDVAAPDQADLIRDLLGRYKTLACMPYYPTKYGEYRMAIAGDTSCVTMLKIPPVGKWRVKSRQGATYERIDAPAELEEMAFRAVRLMGLTLSSVDALPVDGGYVILEVNSVPGSLSMAGKAARQETMNGVYDWVERHAAAADPRHTGDADELHGHA